MFIKMSLTNNMFIKKLLTNRNMDVFKAYRIQIYDVFRNMFHAVIFKCFISKIYFCTWKSHAIGQFDEFVDLLR